MLLITFFAASIVRRIIGVFLGIIALAVVFVVVVGTLAATGGPRACTPGDGPITVNAANSASFQGKWDALSNILGNGGPSSATFSESELSSRADTYLRQKSADFSDARICVHNGSSEGSATFSFLGIHVKAKARGTVDLSGAHPKAHIDHMDVGNVPGWLTSPVERVVNRAIDSTLNGVTLKHRYTSTLTNGRAAISGVP